MKTLFDLTTEIAASASVSSPTPPLFDVVFSIYQELGGSNNPKTTYDTLQAMLDENLVSGGGGITPTGVIEIITNGDFDVTQYASASVNVPQGVFPEGTINITRNGTYIVQNYSSASVSVPVSSSGIDLTSGVKLGYSSWSSLPSDLQSSNWGDVTSFHSMFRSCSNLETITSLDTSNGTDFQYMFDGCTSLVSLPVLDVTKACTNTSNKMSYILKNCSSLTTLGGFTGLRWNLSLSTTPNLTRQSILNIINEALAAPAGGAYRLTVHADVYARLQTSDFSAASNKNWNIVSA